jgi:putative membrane protein
VPPILESMKPFIVRWLCTTAAVAVAAWMTGIHYSGAASLFAVALLLGLVNAFVRPVFLVLGLPFIVVTLGFAILVLNALLFWMVSGLVPDFKVSGFGQAFFAALIVSVVNWVLSLFFKTSDGRYHLISHHGVEKRLSGRVIDVDIEPRP